MERALSDRKMILLFVMPAFLVFFVIVLLPIAISFYFSLLKWNGIGSGTLIGLKNYISLFSQGNDVFVKSILNSFILVIISVFIQLPAALILALILANKIKGENFFRTVYFIPMTLSTVVVGQLWMKIYQPDYGMLNTVLNFLGLGSWTREWLGDPGTAMLSAFVPGVWQYIGYYMLIMYAGIKAIPEELFEAARIDGASYIKTALKITIPLLRPIAKTCVIFALIGSLKVFDTIYVMTKGGPMHASEVPSTVMYNSIFVKNMYGYGSSIAVFIVLECLIMTFIVQKSFKVEKSI